MKRLILVRHGKSSWEHEVTDGKRPLKKRGIKDGELIASAFEKFSNKHAIVWSSPALRALETAKIFKKKLQIEDQVFFIRSGLYTFDKNDLLKQIESCDPQVQTLMVFGHNPAMTGLVNQLGNQYFENIPTTGLTVLDFETESWKGLIKGKTILNLFPKNL
jgi:phosphohistidine phosphatase